MAKTVLILSKTPQLTPVLRLMRGDANSQTIELRVKQQFGGIDLSELSWSIKYENAEGQTDIKILGVATERLGDYLVTYWTPGALVAAAAGTTKFMALGVRGENVVWQSTEYKIEVGEGVNDDIEIPEDALTELQIALRDLATVYAAKDAADAAAARADEATEASRDATDAALEAIENIQNAADTAGSRIDEAVQMVTEAGQAFATQASNAAETVAAYAQNVSELTEQSRIYSVDTQAAANRVENAADDVAANAAAANAAKVDAEAARDRVIELINSIGDMDFEFDGGYYTPSVDEEGWLVWTGSKEGMPEIPATYVKGQNGLNGADGVTYTPSITDDGILTWTPNREGVPEIPPVRIVGAKGDPGKDGAKGDDGAPGGVYIPHVDENGDLSWTSTDPTLPPIDPVNIKGDGADIVVDQEIDSFSENPISNAAATAAISNLADEIQSLVRVDVDEEPDFIDVPTYDEFVNLRDDVHKLAQPHLRLVEEISNWNGTISIIRDIEPDGTPYNFRKVYIEAYMAAGTGSYPCTIRCGNASSANAVRANVLSAVNTDPRYFFAYFEYIEELGVYKTFYSGGVPATSNASYTSVYTNVDFAASNPLSYLQIAGNNGFPSSGNRVKIYAAE